MNASSTSYPLKMFPLLSGSALKIIAVVSMVIDHCAYYLMDGNTMAYDVMRCFGRIAFPVFAFLVAEGFAHTRNRMRYFISLLLFAAVSEVPWYLLNGADGTHNVMFTLALGVSALAVFERLREHRILCCFFILLTAWLATWLGTDYEWRGVLLIVVSYLFGIIRSMNTPIILRRMMQLLFVFPLMMHYGIIGALLACAVIFLYDGTRGFIHGNVAKYGFYAFYPVHLITILIINMSYEF
ncbi:TraX family protein [Bacteroides ovatus]|uniref:TraX family protein n=1 Tax=Bacteroides ovatus TaxID=28116 RepID=UPI00233F6E4E|nr:TraX family protein [Bacteroides ovatus]MDC2748221.1 TraX family protein [Bacteroides ovatus]MDC2758751.1 TraX family protein [Bacteroides ovatus]